jgi:hypothetical protein
MTAVETVLFRNASLASSIIRVSLLLGGCVFLSRYFRYAAQGRLPIATLVDVFKLNGTAATPCGLLGGDPPEPARQMKCCMIHSVHVLHDAHCVRYP